MRVLGIDPGIERVGWGVIDIIQNKLVYIACGCITTPRTLEDGDRLLQIHKDLTGLLATMHPDMVNIEKLFFSKNKKTALRVAQARGVIVSVLVGAGLSIHEFTPPEVKRGVTGIGNAEKRQVAWMVKNILKIKEPISSDDALDALALCLMAPR